MIRIISVGKLKEEYLKEAQKEYQKRLSKYGKIEYIEVLDEKTEQVGLALEKEKERIEKYLSDKDYLITLEIEGKMYDSLTFSTFLEHSQMTYGTITFLIGGSCGIHEDLKKRANEHISFSKMTFPHQLFKILLLEQIYRGYKILHHESYHK